MRRRQEDKEDDPFMASGCQHAQSELMCTARKIKVDVSMMYTFAHLLYLLFQENKSFGASTICIHPLMQEAVSGTVLLDKKETRAAQKSCVAIPSKCMIYI
jgi:hypothetical protein